MKRSILESMTAEELDEYAKLIGAKTDGLKPKAAKVDAILARANRTIDVEAAGFKCTVDARNLSNMNLESVQAEAAKSVSGVRDLGRALLGEEQEQGLWDYATDEDGRTDAYMYGYILGKVATAVNEKK